MAWKIYDYICRECGLEFEEMVKSADEWVDCKECEKGPCEILPTAKLGWTNDPAIRKEKLMKRSREHTQKEQKAGNMLSPRDITGK